MTRSKAERIAFERYFYSLLQGFYQLPLPLSKFGTSVFTTRAIESCVKRAKNSLVHVGKRTSLCGIAVSSYHFLEPSSGHLS